MSREISNHTSACFLKRESNHTVPWCQKSKGMVGCLQICFTLPQSVYAWPTLTMIKILQFSGVRLFLFTIFVSRFLFNFPMPADSFIVNCFTFVIYGAYFMYSAYGLLIVDSRLVVVNIYFLLVSEEKVFYWQLLWSYQISLFL